MRVELVEVEYEELPVLVDPFEALETDVVLREDSKARDKPMARTARASTTTTSSPGKQGDKDATEQVLAEADVVAEEMVYLPPHAPLPAGDLRLRGQMDKVNGKLTLWGTFQAPHAIRTVVADLRH